MTRPRGRDRPRTAFPSAHLTTRSRAPRRRWIGCARATPTQPAAAASAGRARRSCLRCKDAAQRLTAGATDIVFLGTGGSSLGGQTLAQLAGLCGARASAPCATGRASISWTISIRDSFGRLARETAARDHALRRDLEVRRHRRDPDADHGRACRAARRRGSRRIAELFLGLSEPAKRGKRNGLRDLLEPARRRLLEHDTGVGGRFSVLTNVGLLPAAMLGLDIVALRDGAAKALAPVLAKKPAPKCRLRSARRCRSRWRRQRQDHHAC